MRCVGSAFGQVLREDFLKDLLKACTSCVNLVDGHVFGLHDFGLHDLVAFACKIVRPLRSPSAPPTLFRSGPTECVASEVYLGDVG